MHEWQFVFCFGVLMGAVFTRLYDVLRKRSGGR